MSGATTIRVVTWNLFHGRDGLPGLGATAASTWLRRAVDDGSHLHLNRKWIGEMAACIAAWAPDLCALQEVPTSAVRTIVARTGMLALGATTGPLIGPARLRDALAARNPDLWLTHEGNANLLLLGPRLRLVPGSARPVRLNPIASILRSTVRLRLEAGEVVRYLLEPRRAVVAQVEAGGTRVAAASLHCHNARNPALIGTELARAAAALDAMGPGGPAILAGDLNARPGHAAFGALSAAGWDGAAPVPGIGIDRILHRALDAVEEAHRVPAAERELVGTWRGETRRVRLSDHDPVLGVYRVRGSAS
jgi:endonuclease/exonuclease/phosphatase family metal-dependent hydrolase